MFKLVKFTGDDEAQHLLQGHKQCGEQGSAGLKLFINCFHKYCLSWPLIVLINKCKSIIVKEFLSRASLKALHFVVR